MSWLESFLGGNEQDTDVLEHERRLRQIRRPSAAPSPKDLDQDTHIRTLERENHEMKIYLTALVRLLVRKGTVSRSEIKDLVELAERVREDTPSHSPAHRQSLPALIEPAVEAEIVDDPLPAGGPG